MRNLPIPPTTLSTVPTGGVINPTEPISTNITPKYTGSMPALMAIGASTGPRIRMVGVRSSTMPTAIISSMIATINSRGFSASGPSIAAISPGSCARVIM